MAQFANLKYQKQDLMKTTDQRKGRFAQVIFAAIYQAYF